MATQLSHSAFQPLNLLRHVLKVMVSPSTDYVYTPPTTDNLLFNSLRHAMRHHTPYVMITVNHALYHNKPAVNFFWYCPNAATKIT